MYGRLESALERAILLCEDDTDHPRRHAARNDAEWRSVTSASGDLFKLPAEGVNFEDVERSLIMQAMDRTDNNITKSAKLLGLTHSGPCSTVWRNSALRRTVTEPANRTNRK